MSAPEMLRTSESVKVIIPAFVAAQKQIGTAGKNSTNSDFNSDYADLASVREAAFPALHSHGIAVMQFPTCRDGRTYLTTRLWHESGEWIESTCDTKLQRDDAQGLGSAITYLRRYCLAAMCGVTQADDDGAAASPKSPRERKPAPAETLVNAGPLLHRYKKATTREELKKANAEAREHWDEYTAEQQRQLSKAHKEADKRIPRTQKSAEHDVLVEQFGHAGDEVEFLQACDDFESAREHLTQEERDTVLNAQEMARERIEAQGERVDMEGTYVE